MSVKERPSQIVARCQVRMPEGLRDWIASEARRSNRSANAQAVWMLERMREQIEDRPASRAA